jgi:hypothetical protein
MYKNKNKNNYYDEKMEKHSGKKRERKREKYLYSVIFIQLNLFIKQFFNECK